MRGFSVEAFVVEAVVVVADLVVVIAVCARAAPDAERAMADIAMMMRKVRPPRLDRHPAPDGLRRAPYSLASFAS